MMLSCEKDSSNADRDIYFHKYLVMDHFICEKLYEKDFIGFCGGLSAFITNEYAGECQNHFSHQFWSESK